MFELQYIIHGFYPVPLGVFDTVQMAVDALKEHVRVHSAISKPFYKKSWCDNRIRIDYGAKDCYYRILLTCESERE